MLRITTKKQIKKILLLLKKLHKKEISTQILEECQQAAISVGTLLETVVEETEGIVSHLENYCEQLYVISQSSNVCLQQMKRLEETLAEIEQEIDKLPAVYQIVFFPYKAEMWDSLESIWLACKDDVRCECLVVPIPYKTFNKKTNEWEACYEGEKFPEYVPIVDYHTYKIEIEQPDAAFIHNPYNEYNYVTRVNYNYFSYELKKYVKKLFYVPYYVSSGRISDSQKKPPVYNDADYILVQSELFREGFKDLPCYDKVKVFGSPKLDRVIQLCRNGVKVPLEWRDNLKGKKSLMLNTSLSCFLQDGKIYLDKLKYLFEWIKKDGRICLIWRPHPLLFATIQSMTPELIGEYDSLIDYFHEQNIGILDSTQDITHTVAIADGYIGEASSSIINLFWVAQKPVFILDNTITNAFREEEKRSLKITDICRIENKWWITAEYNGLFYLESQWDAIKCIKYIEGQPKWIPSMGKLLYDDYKIYMTPIYDTKARCYDIQYNAIEDIMHLSTDSYLCRSIHHYKSKWYYTPWLTDSVIEYSSEKGKIRYENGIRLLKENVQQTYGETIWDTVQLGRYLWMTANYTNRVLRFDMETGKEEIFAIGEDTFGYSGVTIDGDDLWLAEVATGNLLSWNIETKKTKIYPMPKEFISWRSSLGRAIAHTKILSIGNYIVTIPGHANGMVKLNKETGEISMLLPEIWKDAITSSNGYHPRKNCVSMFAKKIDENSFYVQRYWDNMLFCIQVDTESYEEIIPKLSEETYQELMNGQDGFEQVDPAGVFACRESKLFSLENFIDALVNDRLEDVKKRQKESLTHMAVNLDGTCSQKICEFMMSELEACTN